MATLIGLAGGLLPFFIRYARSNTKTEDGEVVRYSYFDFAALAGGAVAVVCGVITVSWNAWAVLQAALLMALGLLQLSRGVALPRRIAVREQRRRRKARGPLHGLPDKIPVPDMSVGGVADVMRMPVGASFRYSVKSEYMGQATPEQDFLSRVPDRILDNEELLELLNACELRTPIMLLAAERGLDRETMYAIYRRMAAVYEAQEGLDARVPAQTLLNANALEWLVRRQAGEDAIRELFERFAERASFRQIVSQDSTSPLTDDREPRPTAGLLHAAEIAETHEQLRNLLENGRTEEATDLAQQTADATADEYGCPHPVTVFLLGRALLARDRVRPAEGAFRQAAHDLAWVLQQKVDDSEELFAALLESETRLASIYVRLGDLQQAIDRVQKGIGRIRDLAPGIRMTSQRPRDYLHTVLDFLETAATVYTTVGEHSVAATLARAALYQAWQMFGDADPRSARVQILLATVLWRLGSRELAREQFENAVVHATPNAETQLRWASFLVAEGEIGRARELLEAVDVSGPARDWTLLAERAAMLAEVATAEGDLETALASRIDAVRHSDSLLDAISAHLSSGQFREYVAGQFRYVYELVAFVRRYMPDRSDAVRAACDAVLRRKLVASSALRHIYRTAASDPELGGMLDGLRQLQSRIGAARLLHYAALRHDATLAELASQKESLEARLAAAVGGYRIPETDSTQIEAALPEGTALIEYLALPAFALQPGEEPAGRRYVAFVIRGDRPCRMADLGELDPVDALIGEYQARMKRGGRDLRRVSADAPTKEAGGDLRRRIFDPVRALLDTCRNVIIAPDGELCRISFEALPDGGGHLIDAFDMSYSSTGRHLLRETRPRVPCTLPLVIADPDYNLGGTDPADRVFTRLPGARSEGTEIAGMLGVDVHIDAAATERILKDARSPAVLHLATHAYFQDESADMGATAGLSPVETRRRGLRGGGIALAGANTWLAHSSKPDSAEEGLLNVDDILEIDLSGTSLAVLSACETALGDVRIGQGVMGLSHSFFVAGVATLVMSLWQVPDSETAHLMKLFYDGILDGRGCADALRSAQRELKQTRPHSYFWGAFICMGDPGPLPDEVLADIRTRTAGRT